MRRFLAIVIIPQKTSEVKKFRISFRFLAGILILAVSFFAGTGWMYYDFLLLKNQLHDVDSLENIVLSQRQDLEKFYSEYDRLDANYNSIQNQAEKLKQLSNAGIDEKKSARAYEALEKLKNNPSANVLDLIQSRQLADSLNENTLRKKLSDLTKYLSENVNPYSRIPSQWPIRGFVISGFGFKTDPFSDQTNLNGIVIASQAERPVLAPAEGIVINIQETENFGKLVTLYHTNRLVTKYGFLSKADVEFGDRLKKNDTVGTVGSSKTVNAPQLYYEISINGIPQNPVQYIRNE